MLRLQSQPEAVSTAARVLVTLVDEGGRLTADLCSVQDAGSGPRQGSGTWWWWQPRADPATGLASHCGQWGLCPSRLGHLRLEESLLAHFLSVVFSGGCLLPTHVEGEHPKPGGEVVLLF